MEDNILADDIIKTKRIIEYSAENTIEDDDVFFVDNPNSGSHKLTGAAIKSLLEPSPDKTLTVEGKSADSKAVGDQLKTFLTNGYNSITFVNDLENGSFTTGGLNSPATNRLRSKNYYSVVPGGSYTLEFNLRDHSQISMCSVSFYTTNDYVTNREIGLNWLVGKPKIDFIIPNNCNYIRVLFGVQSGMDLNKNDIYNIKLYLNDANSSDKYVKYEYLTGKTVAYDYVQGAAGTYGEVTSSTDIIRTDGCIYVPKGTTMDIAVGSSCKTWMIVEYTLDFSSYKRHGMWSTTDGTVTFEQDCYAVILFRKAVGQALLPSEYDATVKIIGIEETLSINAIKLFNGSVNIENGYYRYEDGGKSESGVWCCTSDYVDYRVNLSTLKCRMFLSAYDKNGYVGMWNGSTFVTSEYSESYGLSNISIKDFSELYPLYRFKVSFFKHNQTIVPNDIKNYVYIGTYKTINVEWIKGLMSAQAILVPDNNGASSCGIIHGAKKMLLDNCRSVISFYNGTSLLGKLDTSMNMNTVAGSYYYYNDETVIDVEQYLKTYNANGIKISLAPNNDTVTRSNQQLWGDVHCRIIGTEEKFEDYITNDDHTIFTICHRGYTPEAPENTLEAYVLAKKYGYKYVETDIDFTSDGVPVLLHDTNINVRGRNSDGTAISQTISINDITYEQAEQYDFGIYHSTKYAGTKLPKFSDFMSLCKKLGLIAVLDLKGSSLSSSQKASLTDIIINNGMQDNIIIGSAIHSIVTDMHAEFPNALVMMSNGDYSNMQHTNDRIQWLNSIKSNGGKVAIVLEEKYATEAHYTAYLNAGIDVVWCLINNIEPLSNIPSNVIGMYSENIHVGNILQRKVYDSYNV